MCQLYWLLLPSGIQPGTWRLKKHKMFFIDNLDCRIVCTFNKFAADIVLVVGRMGLGEKPVIWRAVQPFRRTSERLRNCLKIISHFRFHEGKCNALHIQNNVKRQHKVWWRAKGTLCTRLRSSGRQKESARILCRKICQRWILCSVTAATRMTCCSASVTPYW